MPALTAIIIVMAALATAHQAAFAQDEATTWSLLRAGGHVALTRHADAPGPMPDPPGFKLEDCATQRNLSAEGRKAAAAMGEALRACGIVVSRVISSPWCRCLDTARLMNVGEPSIEPAIANALALADRRDELTSAARQLIGRWQGPGILLAVTHGANILALTGYSAASGEIVVVRTGPDGSIVKAGHIRPGGRYRQTGQRIKVC